MKIFGFTNPSRLRFSRPQKFQVENLRGSPRELSTSTIVFMKDRRKLLGAALLQLLRPIRSQSATLTHHPSQGPRFCRLIAVLSVRPLSVPVWSYLSASRPSSCSVIPCCIPSVRSAFGRVLVCHGLVGDLGGLLVWRGNVWGTLGTALVSLTRCSTGAGGLCLTILLFAFAASILAQVSKHSNF